MAREFKRADRVADAVQRALAQVIPREIRDPRLGLVNINSVDVSRDLANARVFFTLIGQDDNEQSKISADILNKAASYLRSLIGKEMTMRSVPILRFHFDVSSIRGQELSSLIDQAVSTDRAKSQPEDSSEG